jgi:hypothetical protein
MDDPEVRVWGRELAVEALNLNLLRLNRRLLILNLRLLRMNVELLKNAERKTPLMNRLLRRLRKLRLDAFWRLRNLERAASTSTGKAVDDPGLELVRLEVADLMRLIDALKTEELLRRTGG